jgi:hypothetical protein
MLVTGLGPGINSASAGNIYAGSGAGDGALGDHHIVIGEGAAKAMQGGDNNIVIGEQAGRFLKGADNSVMGYRAGHELKGYGNVAIGKEANMVPDNPNIGPTNPKLRQFKFKRVLNTVAIGTGSRAKGNRSVAIGKNAQGGGGLGEDAVALGANASAEKGNDVAIGQGSKTTMDPAAAKAAVAPAGFTVGEVKVPEGTDATGEANFGDRLITGVADGRVAEGSADAVNGHQLYGVAKAIKSKLSDINGQTVTNTRNIAVNRKDININRGNIAYNRRDIDNNSNRIDKVQSDLGGLRDESRAGIAVALSMDTPYLYPDQKHAVSVAAGRFHDATALGVSYRGALYHDVKENQTLSAFAGLGGDVKFKEVGLRVGLTFQW